ncbi:MAG: sugar ABC transporter permease [Chloroflexi bacterium]|nr:sugar ABC transporter permease [Chloroflexota bacterium]
MATITQTPTRLPGDQLSTWESFRQGVRASGIPWLFILPSLVVMLIITFVPQAYQIWISFTDFTTENLGGLAPSFIGLDNYRDVFEGLNVPNYNFFPLLGFNITWTFVNVTFHVVLGVAVALALNAQYVLGRRIYRVVFVLPWALPAYVTGLIWNNMWQQNGGGINLLLESANENLGTAFTTNINWLGNTIPPLDLRGIIPLLIVLACGAGAFFIGRNLQRQGLRDEDTGRLSVSRSVFGLGLLIILGAAAVFTLLDIFGGSQASNVVIQLFDRAGAPTLAFYAVLVANIWLGWPFMMVVATGALQSIPPDLYEAADVDGATRWQQFLNITIPMIRPAMVPAIMLGTVWTFNQFNVIFFITSGGPRGQTDILVTQAYKLIQQEQLYGAAAAFTIVVFFILLVITLIQNRVTSATKAYDEA